MKGMVRMLPLPVPLGTHIDANRSLQQHPINTKHKWRIVPQTYLLERGDSNCFLLVWGIAIVSFVHP